MNEELEEFASTHAAESNKFDIGLIRSALVVGLVASLASLAGSKAGYILSTTEIIGFSLLLGVMVIVELTFTEPMKDALATLFDLNIEEQSSSISHRIGRMLIFTLGISVAILLEKMFSEHPFEAAVVAVQSFIVPTVITYAWLCGAKHIPRRAARYGALSGASLGAILGAFSVIAILLLCLFSPSSCATSTRQILGSASEVQNTSSIGSFIFILSMAVYLLIFSIAMAVLLGLVGSAGILVDRLWGLGPRRALAIAAITANIPFFIVILTALEGNFWVMIGASIGATFGWAGAFGFRRGIPLL